MSHCFRTPISWFFSQTITRVLEQVEFKRNYNFCARTLPQLISETRSVSSLRKLLSHFQFFLPCVAPHEMVPNHSLPKFLDEHEFQGTLYMKLPLSVLWICNPCHVNNPAHLGHIYDMVSSSHGTSSLRRHCFSVERIISENKIKSRQRFRKCMTFNRQNTSAIKQTA